jgi:hypothetical protein
MEANTARLEAAMASAESKITTLAREVETLRQMFIGKIPQVIRVPSGVDGFNETYEVLAQPLGAEPVDAVASGTFLGSYSATNGTIAVGPGSYQYPIGTNVDVPETAAAVGKYAYAVIKQLSGGGLDTFSIEVSSTTKDAINMDSGNTFVEFSNVLLAEVVLF